MTTAFRPKRLLTSALLGAVLFFLLGPWLSEVLIDYGFVIFAPSLIENTAMVAGASISFPAAFFQESLPVSRPWMLLNGAVWGAVIYLVVVGSKSVWRKRRRQDA